MALDFTLSFGGVLFVSDTAKIFRLFDLDKDMDEVLPMARKQQPLVDLIDEVNRMIPFDYQQDFDYPDIVYSRTLNQLAQHITFTPPIKVGDWYYPNTARAWSVFRGLATSTQVKQMTNKSATGSTLSPQAFIMNANPILPTASNATNYRIETNMYMLPARPLADYGQGFDGLYLVTLVDERYHWRYHPTTIRVTSESTWTSILTALASALNITLTQGTIDPIYGKPEPDSHLWSTYESAATLLDAVAYNIGKTVCRLMDGTYVLRTTEESKALAVLNRQSVRNAGGDFFNTNANLKVGDELGKSRNFVSPKTITVSFPKYIGGETPHFYNTRQNATRWIEDSYGEAYNVNVPIASGGSAVSGIVGIGTHAIRENAKAIYAAESDALPTNQSGLTSLAMQLAQDHWEDRALYGLDESYPGTYKWTPESIHDVVWTYSERRRGAFTRVIRSYWNQSIEEMQHAGHAASGSSHIPAGMGGQSVAQTIRESQSVYSGQITTTLAGVMTSGASTVSLTANSYFPTQNRWRGKIESEVIVFEGTSGGTSVGVVRRAADGTLASEHAGGTTITQLPGVAYGVNLTNYEKGMYVQPGEMTSGGLFGVSVIPQLQSVKVQSSGTQTINGITCYSGVLQVLDATKSGIDNVWVTKENIWITDRNNLVLGSGKRYEGQFGGYTKDNVAPIYSVTEQSGGGSATSSISGSLQVRNVDNSVIVSGVTDISLHEVDGLIVSQPGAGQTRIDLRTIFSVTANVSGVQFVNDVNAPGDNYYYGTASGGAKGWKPLINSGGIGGGVAVQMSVTADSSGIKFVNDELVPTANYYYGTNSGGTRGWQPVLGVGNKIAVQMSVTQDQSGIKLVNDQNAPQHNYYYGTDSGGTKGWQPILDIGNKIATQMSVTQDQSGIKFVNDQASPQHNYYYGTASGGAKGWWPLVNSSGGLGGGVATQMSVTQDSSGIRLVSDESAPGNSKYYGTSAAGAKGYHALPAAGVVATQMSITSDSSGIKFVNDELTLAANYYYGTASGATTKGWQPFTNAKIPTQMSISQDTSGLRFVNDEESPGGWEYYGTNSGGTKGYYPFASGALVAGGGAQWIKITKTYTNLSAAATTNDIEIYSLPIKGVVHACVLKDTVQFAGPGIGGYNVTVGVAGNTSEYITTTIVSDAISDTVFTVMQNGVGKVSVKNFGATTSVRLYATSTGANLDQANAGSLDVYLFVATLP